MIKGGVELVDGVWAECVAHLGTIERDADRSLIDGTVIRDVGKREARNFTPGSGVENGRDAHPDIVSCGLSYP